MNVPSPAPGTAPVSRVALAPVALAVLVLTGALDAQDDPEPLPPAPRPVDAPAESSGLTEDDWDWIRLGMPGPPQQELWGTTTDNGWDLSVRALLSLDFIFYDPNNQRDSGFDVERANPIFTGQNADNTQRFWIEADLDGRRTNNHLWQAWYEIDAPANTHLRAGLVNVAMTSEAATRTEANPFVGYGFPSFHASRYDWGLQADGRPTDHLWWQTAATIGQGFDYSGDRMNGSPQLSARFVVTPEVDAQSGAFEGPYAGFSVAYNPEYDDRIKVQNAFYQTVFRTPNLDADYAVWRSWEFGWRQGPFRATFENIDGEVANVPLADGSEEDFDQIGAWAASVVWNLHGDAAPWVRGGWRQQVMEEDATWSELPFELGFRYSNSDIDRGFFEDGLTTVTRSTQEVRTSSFSITTWFDPCTRFLLMYSRTIADEDLRTFGNKNPDSSWVLRFDRWF